MSGFRDFNAAGSGKVTKTLGTANDEDDWTVPNEAAGNTRKDAASSVPTSSLPSGDNNWRDEQQKDWLAQKRATNDTQKPSVATPQ